MKLNKHLASYGFLKEKDNLQTPLYYFVTQKDSRTKNFLFKVYTFEAVTTKLLIYGVCDVNTERVVCLTNIMTKEFLYTNLQICLVEKTKGYKKNI